jgi:hypothetical protein
MLLLLLPLLLTIIAGVSAVSEDSESTRNSGDIDDVRGEESGGGDFIANNEDVPSLTARPNPRLAVDPEANAEVEVKVEVEVEVGSEADVVADVRDGACVLVAVVAVEGSVTGEGFGGAVVIAVGMPDPTQSVFCSSSSTHSFTRDIVVKVLND